MKNLQTSKFFTFFQSLEDSQKASFTKFVVNQHAGDSITSKVYHYILKHKNIQNITTCEALANEFQPGLQPKIMANYLSALYALAENWIIQSELEHNASTKDMLISQWMYKQGLDQQAYKLSSSINDTNQLHLKNLLLSQLSHLNILQFNHFSQIDDHYDFLRSMVETNGQLFIYMNRILKIELEALKQIKSHDPQNLMELIDIGLEAVEPNYTTRSLLQDMHHLMTTSDVGLFDYYLQRMITKEWIYDEFTQHLCYMILHKTAGKLYVQGKISDKSVFIQLINFGLEEGITLHNSKLSTSHFHNLINRVSLIQDVPTTAAFINRWMPKVDTKFPKETYQLATLQNHFFHREFDVIEFHRPIASFDSFDQKNINLSIQVAVSYVFKQKNPALFDIRVEQYKSLLKRSKKLMSDALFTSAWNYVTFLANPQPKSSELLANYDPILYKSFCLWLVEKSPTHAR